VQAALLEAWLPNALLRLWRLLQTSAITLRQAGQLMACNKRAHVICLQAFALCSFVAGSCMHACQAKKFCMLEGVSLH
jgi:hypothetical protein